MKIHDFLQHHHIARNPFAEEDAQTDPVFKDHCIGNTYHPSWDKVYGDPAEPSTSIVFGEKGSGKTALRLQIARHLANYSQANSQRRLYVIEYDDFNPFLDRFRDKLVGRKRRADRVLLQFQLWDHMDAILSLGVTRLVDGVFASYRESAQQRDCSDRISAEKVGELDRHQRRDLLLLAACYDHSTAETLQGRWLRLLRRMRPWSMQRWWRIAIGGLGTLAVLSLAVYLVARGNVQWVSPFWWAYCLATIIVWLPWLTHGARCFRLAWGIVRRLRVGNRQVRPLCRMLMRFTPSELAGQPLPNKARTDDRYSLLSKMQGILQTVGFSGIIVLVDRVDEPHLINGSAELMRGLLWPMLDNKFLKQPGVGIKFMLPLELTPFIEREDRDFYQRARLDKQNMVPSLEWTGEALYDLANARLQACAMDGASPQLEALLDDSIGQRRLYDSFRLLRVPRHLFKFLYRLLVAHCNMHSDQHPEWKISSTTFESELALFTRSRDAAERGIGAA